MPSISDVFVNGIYTNPTHNMWSYGGSGNPNQTKGTVTLTITAFGKSSSTSQTWTILTVGASSCINKHNTATDTEPAAVTE
ncbi:hypothetical protein [Tropheryma whipplei]|uniref:hypothetical protein n=1 Tax=Tropheryma whipplei TaxID=2039 RepID=UPI0003174657|nr:hypothetical protein [Tropheryma whipplei]